MNHHKSHLYTNNPKFVDLSQEYKHFFSKEEIGVLFPMQVFTEKYVEVKDYYPNEKEKMVTEYIGAFFLKFREKN